MIKLWSWCTKFKHMLMEIYSMKRSLIALGIIAAAAVPMVASAAPTVYGKLNLSLDSIKDDTKNSVYQVDSNASRFGVKGENELTASLSAIYQIEWEVAGDGTFGNGAAAADNSPYNGATDLKQRNRYVGIKSQDFGAIKLGQYDTYTKTIGQSIDLFADQLADNANVLSGKTRLAHVFAYESPKLAGINFNLMLQPGEQSLVPNPANAAVSADHGIANAWSSSVTWSSDDLGLSAALGYDKNVQDKFAAFNAPSAAGVPLALPAGVSGAVTVPAGDGTNNYLPVDSAATARTNLLRAIVGYTNKGIGLTVNAEYQSAERSKAYFYTLAGSAAGATALNTTPDAIKPKETGYLFNAAWKFAEGWTGKAQYVASTTKFGDSGASSIKLSEITLGADYNFTTTTKVYGLYSILDTKNPNNPATPAASTPGLDDNVKRKFASVGIEHKF
jgi:predicted porin